MPSQHSCTARLHPAWEGARARQQREASEELARYLVEADAFRSRIANGRILITGQTPASSTGR